MNRREFLKYSALLGLSTVSPFLFTGCDTSRYEKPLPLTTPDEKLLLANASILNVHTGTFFQETKLLIQNGKIAGIFHENDNSITPDYTLDLKGAYILPGLINAHCHMTGPGGFPWPGGGSLLSYLGRQSERNAEECIKHGVTTVRDMLDLLALREPLEKNIAQKKVVGPRIINSFALEVDCGYLNGSLVFAGLSPTGVGNPNTVRVVNSPEEAIKAVKMAVDRGADFIKIAHQEKTLAKPLPNPREMSFDIAKAICDEANRQGLIVAIHHTDTNGLHKGLAAGVTTLEHMSCDRALTEYEIEEIINRQLYTIPTASVGYAIDWETNDDSGWDEGLRAECKKLRAELMPVLLPEYLERELVAPTLYTYKKYTNPDYFDSLEYLIGVNVDATDTILTHGLDNYIRLYEAGAKLGCGNDGGIPFISPGGLGLELYLGEVIGINQKDLIKMATINNAEIIGMENEIGSIEDGKIADLVIFEKNPLETLRHTFNPVYVFQNGELAFKA
ncbi:MAG: amidohydrolase family protein [Proteobacteria bacterium]|nr:amidohydrolase family protein [Pseudomonadota bacterium]